ncbi:MAG: hypothetical protein L3J25_00825 [Flavobacteriaceae bacterium]|nr:hypothetical protein [Flavobacteriaceae bacterium]
MSLHLKVHGVIFSSWIVLSLVQTILISSNRRNLHFTLGWLSVVISVVILLSGSYTSFMKPPMYYHEVGDNLTYIMMFMIFVFLGIKNRKTPNKHKRYLVFATTVLTSAAVARVTVFGIKMESLDSTYYGLLFFPIACLFAYDLFKKKSVFRVNIYNSF